MGGALVAADPGPLPAAYAVAGPTAGRDVPGPAGVAAHARRPQAGAVRRRGPALGGCVHVGVPGAVPGRGPARLHPHGADFPPRVQDAVAGRRPSDQPGPEPTDAAPGRRPDAAKDGCGGAGGAGRAGVRPDGRRAAVRRRVHPTGAGVGRAGPGGRGQPEHPGPARARDPRHAPGPGHGPPGPGGGRPGGGPVGRDARPRVELRTPGRRRDPGRGGLRRRAGQAGSGGDPVPQGLAAPL